VTDIVVEYHRPSVNDRKVWGALVPFDQVWRAGANENTTISFSTEVTVGGKKIPAGIYGLHLIPSESGSWTIIFSKDYRAWGSFFYNEANDQARVTVKTENVDNRELLTYSFDEVTPNSATLALYWEKMKVPVKIDVDSERLVVKDIEQQLTSLPGFGWQGYNQAANYLYQNDIDLDKALAFSDQSIQRVQNVTNTFTKAVILEAKGNKEEAKKLKEQAFVNAQENDINNLGYQFLFAGKTDKALEIFQKNVEMYPDSWNVWDSLAECYMNKGETEKAVEFYNKALNMAPETQHARINGQLAQLQDN
jgi:tetratricopeptide (TPR) repeat protein